MITSINVYTTVRIYESWLCGYMIDYIIVYTVSRCGVNRIYHMRKGVKSYIRMKLEIIVRSNHGPAATAR
jgi:hypothetical protein